MSALTHRLGRNIVRGLSSVQITSVRHLTIPEGFKRWAYNAAGFNKYGLYHNDLYYEDAEVKEALRRLSPTLQDERVFRIQRAAQLTLLKSILPKEEWITYEEDREKGRYLDALLEEVKRENEEKQEWSKKA